MTPTSRRSTLRRVVVAGLAASLTTGITGLVPSAFAAEAEPADQPASSAVHLSAPVVTPGRVVLLDEEIFQPVPSLEPPADLVDAVAVATSAFVYGGNTALAVRRDGSVVGWGSDSFGQASVPAGLGGVVKVDVGGGFGLALRNDGSVTAWGSNASGVLDVPTDLGPVIDIAAGGTITAAEGCGYALALRPDGTVVRWGRAQADGTCRTLNARFDPPAGLTNVVSVSAGDTAAIALKDDGTVVAWGPSYNPNGNGIILGRWSDIVDVSTRGGRFVGLRENGQTISLGFQGQTPLPPMPDGIVRVSAGYPAGMLDAEGRVIGYSPVLYTSEPSYSAVAAGYYYLLAIERPELTEPTEPTDPPTEPTDPPTDPTEPTDPPTDPGVPTEPSALGSSAIQPAIDANPAGTAEAFRSVATRGVTAGELRLYLDHTSTARSLVVGIYSDRDGEPGRLLGSGRTRELNAGDWVTVDITDVPLVEGQAYWLALLTPVRGGVVRFRDLLDGDGGATRISKQKNLTWRSGLPREWRSGRHFANAPASFHVV